MKPLLAHTFTPNRWRPGTDVWLQPKLNGIRALYQNGNFQSRDEIPWHPEVLQHLIEPLKAMFEPHHVLDGELYVHGWRLQDINAAIAVNRHTPTEKSHLVEYHIFDRVSYQLPFEERFMNLMKYKGLFTDDIKVKLVDTMRTNDPGVVEDYYAICVHDGYEGMMYRLGNCLYTRPKEPITLGRYNGRMKFLSDKDNRCWHLLKRKDWRDDEFTCVRVEEGLGKRANMVGALICETKDGVYFGVGSGLTDEEAIHYYENPPIGRKVKVKFLCYTSDGSLFNPTVIAVL